MLQTIIKRFRRKNCKNSRPVSTAEEMRTPFFGRRKIAKMRKAMPAIRIGERINSIIHGQRTANSIQVPKPQPVCICSTESQISHGR